MVLHSLESGNPGGSKGTALILVLVKVVVMVLMVVMVWIQ